MKLPPLIVDDDENALCRILKSIARNEEALAACASAEAKKLHVLIGLLEKTGYSTANFIMGEEGLRNNALSALQVTYSMHQSLNSRLDLLLEYSGLGALRNLTPLPSNCSCTISAGGTGYVANTADYFHSGLAHLRKLYLTIKGGTVIDACLQYRAGHSEAALELEAITDGLDLYFIDHIDKSPAKKAANACLIAGYGVVKLIKGTTPSRNIVSFALTLWDSGKKAKQDKFRIVVYDLASSAFVHDSGIVL